MRRRDFITGIAVSAVMPLAAQAQEPGRIYRLAFMIPSPRQAPATIAFFDELRRNGFSEGQYLAVIPDGFDADYEHVAELAASLVKAGPDAIIAGPQIALRALQSLTHTIPLIGISEDMVAEGLVTSLARPGGNITGISLLSPELDGKRQDILIEAVPAARFLSSPLFSVPGSQNNRVVIDRVAAARLPSIFQFPETAEAGALAGYGPRVTDLYRQRARITVQVLRGTKPADIPVQQPDRFELVINLKAAKAIGLEVPATLVARADKLIDERT